MRKLLAVVCVSLAVMLGQAALAADSHGAGASAGGPQWFVVELKHGDMSQLDASAMAGMQDAMNGHIKYMDELYDQGILYMAGPYTDDSNLGAGIILADSAETIKASLEQDPGFKAGIFTIASIHPWWPVFNKPMGLKLTPEQMAAMAGGGAPPMAGADGAMSSGGESQASGGGPPMTSGGIGFIEFPSKSVAESKTFYSKVFGWDFDSMAGDPAMADMADSFALFMAPGGMTGAFNTQFKPTTDGPVIYINCDSVKAKLAEVEAAGGKTTMASMKLPSNWGHIGTFTDPHGNQLGLWSMGE